LARLLAELTEELLPGAKLLGPPKSCLEEAARDRVGFLAEGFVDRAYRSDGSLVPRGEPGALLEDRGRQAEQALALARGVSFEGAEGRLTLKAQTLCIHGDSPKADVTAGKLRAALEKAKVSVQPYDR
jgi:UPF0271 protein